MNKFKELTKKRGFIIVLIVLAIVLVGSLGTYAMFYWRSTNNTEITLKIGEVADVVFPDGQELNTNNLAPVFNYTDGETLSFSIKNKDTTGATIKYTVNFNITNIDEQLRSTQLKYKLLQGNTVVGQGNFSNATSNSTMKLAKGKLSSGTSNYTLYIYIDSNVENDPNMMNKNLRGVVEVTAVESVGENLAEYITNLYLDNKDAVLVTNNGIEYRYASSVNLMNDRLGDASVGEDAGNIRFYGSDAYKYFDEDDGTMDGYKEVGNWEQVFENNGVEAPFDDSEGCNTFAQNNNLGDDSVAEFGFNTVEEFCSTSPKYYKSLHNYIDIGDKYETEATIGNWEENWPLKKGTPSTSEECYNIIQNDLSENNENWEDWWAGETGYNTLEEFCSTTTIPAGTPILWRIIGVFDGKLRIRRDESIGAYSFDTSAGDINGGSGINEWSQADLMKLLNPGYENNQDLNNSNETITVNNSLWWNSGSGTCYNDYGNTTTSCDFTNTGLSDEAKEYVVDQTLYLGGFDRYNVFANETWTIERGSNVIQNPIDGIARTLSWTGKVGLIYPSDFGYAADFRDSNCQGNLATFEGKEGRCTENWMNGLSWTVSPWSSSAYSEMIVNVGRFRNSKGVSSSNGGWPTLLLNSSVMALGTGSKDDPYVLQ